MSDPFCGKSLLDKVKDLVDTALPQLKPALEKMFSTSLLRSKQFFKAANVPSEKLLPDSLNGEFLKNCFEHSSPETLQRLLMGLCGSETERHRTHDAGALDVIQLNCACLFDCLLLNEKSDAKDVQASLSFAAVLFNKVCTSTSSLRDEKSRDMVRKWLTDVLLDIKLVVGTRRLQALFKASIEAMPDGWENMTLGP